MQKLLTNIRKSLSGDVEFVLPEHKLLYDKEKSQIYITLFQEKLKPIRWGSKKNDLQSTIERIIYKLKSNERFHMFNVEDSSKCRILFEIVTDLKECNIRNLTTLKFSKDRFEPGITGLKYNYKGIVRYFMPTDAIVNSIMSVNQLLNYLSKQCGIYKKTNKISERVHLMRTEPIEYFHIFSKSFVTYNDEAIELERGIPSIDLNKSIIKESMLKSVDWLVENMNEDGSFLYFYDPCKNTIVDDLHPNMINPLYNNILRHSGGTITLLRAYEHTNNEIYLKSAKKSLDFLVSTFREHKYKNEYACYPFFNKKSKLGGAGIGLVALMHYYIHTRDLSYKKYMDGLVRHILSRVDRDGEMIGYYIHPKFNNGKAIINPDDDTKKELFSFYYPGEALLGLALYYRYIENIDEEFKIDIATKSIQALDFLIYTRPIKYDYLFTSLPADAWLMQAIEEWIKVDGFKNDDYIKFVYDDTQKMFDQMYTKDNTPNSIKDYIGGFFYNYGDHVYHDASRCEGIVSAYYLAKYLGDENKAKEILERMLLSAKGLMKTWHTPQSSYAQIEPKRAQHSFRFKLTRSWVRVDSVQHAACFFARLIYAIDDSFNSPKKKYEIVSTLDTAGYSTVYLVKDQKQNFFAMKRITESRYLRLIENEIKFSKMANTINSIKFIEFIKNEDSINFIFDYAKDLNLKKYVEKNGSISLNEAYNFLSQILKSLHFMENNNILHLDLKPANILLDSGKYNLADWGNATFGKTVRTIHLKGNPIYIAPEFYFGERTISSEIYSLGCSLYFLLTGKHIYNNRNRHSLVRKIYRSLYVQADLSSIKSNKMKYLLSQMLQKDSSKRITLNELKKQLKRNENDFINIEFEKVKNNDIDFADDEKLFNKIIYDNVPFVLNERGREYIKDEKYQQAYEIFYKAANLGYVNAQLNLALMYYSQKYKMIDLEKAFFWIEKASQEEYDKAQYYMGIFYEKGLSVEKDFDKAIFWFKKSARNGYRKAYNKLNEYNINLTLNIDGIL